MRNTKFYPRKPKHGIINKNSHDVESLKQQVDKQNSELEKMRAARGNLGVLSAGGYSDDTLVQLDELQKNRERARYGNEELFGYI